MLESDLTKMYGAKTSQLNEQVKRKADKLKEIEATV